MGIPGDMGGDQDVGAGQEPIQLLALDPGVGIQFLIFKHVQGGTGYLALFKGPDQGGGIMYFAPGGIDKPRLLFQ